ncbi:MAG TPA: hypothetical protein VHZ55_04660 [Bryobacteraceae bacterium]|nr:hypothetical protein [Bryobacteraceae bacterium]
MSYETLGAMARVVVRYTFAALLALLAMHGVTPETSADTPAAFVSHTRAQQRIARPAVLRRAVRLTQRVTLQYASRIRPEPEPAILFQRPPPTLLRFT